MLKQKKDFKEYLRGSKVGKHHQMSKFSDQKLIWGHVSPLPKVNGQNDGWCVELSNYVQVQD